MSTYSDSAIRKARINHICASCSAAIMCGDEYLSYALGQRNRIAVCMQCTEKRNKYEGLQFDCHALRKRIGLPDRRI